MCAALPEKFKIGLRCARNQHVTAESPDAIVVVEAAGDANVGPVDVSYFSMEGCAKRFFRCEGYRATLSVDACAANWGRSQRLTSAEPGFTGLCRQCPIGALHSNEEFIPRSKLFGLTICSRTRKWASRLIGDRLRVSAYNRQMESLKGWNAKHTKPLLRLDPRRLGVIVNYGAADQRYFEIRDELTRDAIELAVQTLRTIPGRIAFSGHVGGQR